MPEYVRIFDSTSPQWSENVEFNLMFLQVQKNFWNDMLKARGHVFLNEVCESLGFPHTAEGAVIGWTMSGHGDNEIEFNPEEVEEGVRLDFNVDGFILDKLGKGAVR
jgi:Family of unknown function (DUF6353)